MPKKVVLTFPILREGTNDTNFMEGRFPHSLLYLARNIPEYDVEIFDQRNPAFDWDAYLKSVDEAMCVGFTVLTGYQIHSALKICRKIRAHNPTVPIVWGGWHASLDPKGTMEDPVIDYAVLGQGEAPFRELLQHFEGKFDIDKIEGLAYRKEDGEVVIRPPRKIANSSDFPEVNYGLIDCSKYFYKTDYAERAIGLFATHGCPYECGFCSIYMVYKRRWFAKDIGHIIREIKYLQKEYNIDSVSFDDDNFFVNLAFSQNFMRALIDEKVNIKWAANAHSSSFLRLTQRDPNLLQLLRDSGCRRLLIGAETGNDEILQNIIWKHATVEDTFTFVKELKKYDITPVLSTMAGFPVGDGTDYLDTTAMITRCKNEYSKTQGMVFYYTPYLGTPMYQQAIDNGFNPPKTLEGWASHSLTEFKNPWLTEEARRYIRNYNCFYFYYYQMGSIFYSRNKFKMVAKSMLYLWCKARFKLNFFKYQYDAELFYRLLKFLDKVGLFNLGTSPWTEYEVLQERKPEPARASTKPVKAPQRMAVGQQKC